MRINVFIVAAAVILVIGFMIWRFRCIDREARELRRRRKHRETSRREGSRQRMTSVSDADRFDVWATRYGSSSAGNSAQDIWSRDNAAYRDMQSVRREPVSTYTPPKVHRDTPIYPDTAVNNNTNTEISFDTAIIGSLFGDILPSQTAFVSILPTELQIEPLILNDILNVDDLTENIPLQPAQQNSISSDTQNVHDSSVNATLRQSIQRIIASQKESGHPINAPNYIAEINAAINTVQLSEHDRDLARKGLEKLHARNISLMSLDNMTESSILELIWARIAVLDRDSREAAVENLVLALRDGSDTCATGRVARVVDSINLIDPNVSIKPTWAIRQEMLAKSAQIRESLYNKLSDEEQQVVDLDPDSTFNSQLKSEIRAELQREYVDSHILRPDQFEREMHEWLDYV